MAVLQGRTETLTRCGREGEEQHDSNKKLHHCLFERVIRPELSFLGVGRSAWSSFPRAEVKAGRASCQLDGVTLCPLIATYSGLHNMRVNEQGNPSIAVFASVMQTQWLLDFVGVAIAR